MLNMSEDEFLKKLKKKMAICTILQRKFGCKCAKNDKPLFCDCVEELYSEQENNCHDCDLYKEAHIIHEWER